MLNTIFVSLEVLVTALFAYWFVLGLCGFGRAKKLEMQEPEKKFLILIPAHNEEAVVGDLLDNLNNLDYPRELYDVLLIADECSDSTAQIGRDKGAIVMEHKYFPDEPKGKPHAIRYALDNTDLDQYDAVCVFDADNLVTLNYLKEMNNHLIAGHRVIQCYLDTKNPRDNFITVSYAVSYYMMNRSWQLAKSRLGLGNAIGGTGFCVEREMFNLVGWTAQSLTEDLEFTMQALLKGVKTHWAHHCKVYDEKPTGFKASCIQRLRWARGHWDVCFRYALPLLKKSIKERDFVAFDGVLYLINPGKAVMTSMISVMYYLSLTFGHRLYEPFIPLWVYVAILVFNLCYVGYTIWESKQQIHVTTAYLSLLFMTYSYVPLFVWSLVTFTNRVWVRTEHTKSKSLEEIDQVNVSA